MSGVFNVYCDESCHLEHDESQVMVLGALWCPAEDARAVSLEIRDIKRSHGLGDHFESKWVKISPMKLAFYDDLIDYFFRDDRLHFRGVVICDKAKLRHGDFGQTHDEWYYKMYFALLEPLIKHAGGPVHIYLDIQGCARSGQGPQAS